MRVKREWRKRKRGGTEEVKGRLTSFHTGVHFRELRLNLLCGNLILDSIPVPQ